MLNLIKKKIIKLIIKNQVDRPIKIKKRNNINLNIRTKFLINSFGKKNPNKFFYVIKVDKNGGGGFFANVLFVLNHLKISRKHNFISFPNGFGWFLLQTTRKPTFLTLAKPSISG